MILTVMIVLLLLLLIIGVPIAFAFALSGFLGGWFSGIPIGILSASPYNAVASIPLLAIPFFILAGELMNRGKLIDRLIDLTSVTLSWLKGRLGHVTIVASAFLGAMTGSSVATVAAISSSIGEKMMAVGYKRGYVAALCASAGLLGVLIPPSIPLIIYGSAVGASVSDLFLATLIPGILYTMLFMIIHKFSLKKALVPTQDIPNVEAISNFEKGSFSQAPKFVFRAIPALFLPIIVLGGIYSGITTPTEAGVIAAAYALFVILIGKMVKITQVPNIFYRAALLAASIMAIIAFTSVFNKILTLMQVPQAISDYAATITDNPIVFLLMVNIVCFLVGMFMETNAAVLLMAPLLYPAAMSFGIDPIHFGIVLVINIEIGLITPPMAANLFVSSKINKSSIPEMFPYILRFLIPSVLMILVLTYVPQLSLWWK